MNIRPLTVTSNFGTFGTFLTLEGSRITHIKELFVYYNYIMSNVQSIYTVWENPLNQGNLDISQNDWFQFADIYFLKSWYQNWSRSFTFFFHFPLMADVKFLSLISNVASPCAHSKDLKYFHNPKDRVDTILIKTNK